MRLIDGPLKWWAGFCFGKFGNTNLGYSVYSLVAIPCLIGVGALGAIGLLYLVEVIVRALSI